LSRRESGGSSSGETANHPSPHLHVNAQLPDELQRNAVPTRLMSPSPSSRNGSNTGSGVVTPTPKSRGTLLGGGDAPQPPQGSASSNPKVASTNGVGTNANSGPAAVLLSEAELMRRRRADAVFGMGLGEREADHQSDEGSVSNSPVTTRSSSPVASRRPPGSSSGGVREVSATWSVASSVESIDKNANGV
jgi:hypothetical protein